MSTIKPEQCRAARSWLNWRQDHLADRARIGQSTVKTFEKGGGKRGPMKNNLLAIERAFREAGISFNFAEDGRATGITASGAAIFGKTEPTEPQGQGQGKRPGNAARGRRDK